MIRFKNHLSLLAWTVLAVLSTGTTSARASDELRKGLADMAQSIKKLLDGRGEDSIVVGTFAGPANFPTSAGPLIQQVLSEELHRLGIAVRKRAKLGIKGEYLVTEVPADEPADVDEVRRPRVLAIRLKGTVEDEFGKVVTDADFHFKQAVVKGESAFVDLIGVPVELPPRATNEERDRKLRETLSRPKTHINRTRVSAGLDGKMAIEMLVDGKPCAVSDDEGLAYLAASLPRETVYGVRLINDTDQEMAVELRIDGLSMFQFSELRNQDGPRKGQPLYTSIILGPRTHFDVKGWHRNNERSEEFKVKEYAQTAAASVAQPGNLGTVTANFRASWPKGASPPADEPSRTKGTTSGDGTGFGRSFAQRYKQVERSTGVLRASVSVRYAR